MEVGERKRLVAHLAIISKHFRLINEIKVKLIFIAWYIQLY